MLGMAKRLGASGLKLLVIDTGEGMSGWPLEGMQPATVAAAMAPPFSHPAHLLPQLPSYLPFSPHPPALHQSLATSAAALPRRLPPQRVGGTTACQML